MLEWDSGQTVTTDVSATANLFYAFAPDGVEGPAYWDDSFPVEDYRPIPVAVPLGATSVTIHATGTWAFICNAESGPDGFGDETDVATTDLDYRTEEYASKAKDALTPATGGWGYKWTPELEKIAEDSEIRRIFAEGTKLGPQTIEYRLFDTTKGIAFGPTKTLKIKVEKIVYPFQDQVANWSTQDTAQWKGLAVGEAWYIDKALVDYINKPDLTVPGNQGTLETRRPDGKGADDLPLARYQTFSKDNDSYASNVNYANGFTMEFDYSFAKDHGDASTGYVQAEPEQGKPPEQKLSFVGNSGVKFGKYLLRNPDGTPKLDKFKKEQLKDVEVNILDVKAMAERGGGLASLKSKIQYRNGVANIAVADHKAEAVNTLMTGVRYGGDYRFMNDWAGAVPPASNSPDSVDDYYKILTNNATHTQPDDKTDHMKIEVAKDNATNTFTVTVWVNNESTYRESGLVMTIGIPHLQSHWGSGVVYSNVHFT